MVDQTHVAYLDHAAASPLDPRVREAMAPYLDGEFGSPDGLHDWARGPAAAIDGARERVAALIGGAPDEVIFTSGDTEARNLAVKGIASANAHRGDHLVATLVEHPATLAACRSLTRTAGALTLASVDAVGYVTDIAATLRDSTTLVCVVHGQPEIGTVQDIPSLVAAIKEHAPGVAVCVDAGATVGLLPIDVAAWGCDALVIGGASLFGPRWCGALWVKPGTRIHPLIEGGLQEGGKRAGAHDVAGIAGLGVAAELAAAERQARSAHMSAMADRLIDGLLAVPDVRLNGPRDARVPGHVQVSAGGVEGETLTLAMAARGVAVSPGSACSGAGKASPVLEAIGLQPPWTHSAVLMTLAPTTTDAEIDRAVAVFAQAVAELRAMSPVRELT